LISISDNEFFIIFSAFWLWLDYIQR
jgi:hypothetical protein